MSVRDAIREALPDAAARERARRITNRGSIIAAALVGLGIIIAFATGASAGALRALPFAFALVALYLITGADRRDWAIVLAFALGVSALLTALALASGQVRPGFYLLGVLVAILVYALFATGLNIQFGFTGLINFGHVAFFALGAYAVATFAKRHPACRPVDATEFPGWLDWVCGGSEHLAWVTPEGWGGMLALGLGFFVAFVAAGLFAMLIGIPTLKLREDYLAIVTIGAAEILRITFLNEPWLAGGNPTDSVGGANGVTAYPRPWFSAISTDAGWREIASALTTTPYYVFNVLVTLGMLAAVLVLFTILVKSPWGRVLRAIREDEEVATSLGKNVFRFKMQALILGAFAAALAGIAWAWYVSPVNPSTGLPILTFYAWIILIIGGAGNLRGPIIGSLVLWGIFETARLLPGAMPSGVGSLPIVSQLTEPAGQILLIGVLLVLAMVFRPQGILGKREEMLLEK